MATQTQAATAPQPEPAGTQKIHQLRELFADASEVGNRDMFAEARAIHASSARLTSFSILPLACSAVILRPGKLQAAKVMVF